MKPKPKSKKGIIAGIIILVILALVYFYISGGYAPADNGSLSEAPTAESEAVGVRTLSLLNQIKSLHIDKAMFDDPAYRTLTDYSITIPEVPVGRANPFAPI